MLEKLGDSLKSTLKKIANSIFVDKKLIEELVKDIQRALLQSDVNVSLVFELSNKIKNRALEEKPPNNIDQKEFLIKIVYEELVNFVGEKKHEIKIDKKPTKIMVVGLFGSGKTTNCAKIANYYKKRGKKVVLIQTDAWRPTAFEQLEILGKSIEVPVLGDPKEKDALKIYNRFEKELSKYDLVLIDTAGRDALNNILIKEISSLNKKINPDEVLLVVSADIGQAAKELAEKFHETCNVTGVMVTKMDGTAKAGGALSACAATKSQIIFIGTGEKIDDFELFNPTGFVGRLLGMGDLEALLEKSKEAISEQESIEMGKKLLKGEFNFLDLYEQINAMKKLGPLNKIMEMIPGLSSVKIPKDMLNVQEEKLKQWRYVFDSCTKEELEDPEILDGSRIQRIALGSGVPASTIRELLKQYKLSKKMIKSMKGKDPMKLMQKFKGGFPGF